jgi:glucokinase
VSSVIGVDLGGTKVAVASLSGSQLSDSTMEPTDRSGADALLDQIARMVQSVAGEDLAGVGIGVPSIVEFATGRVVASVNIPLKDVPLRSALGDRLRVPVFVDNDATVAALAEAHDEQLRLVAHNLVMLTIGTGVGGGIVLGGRIFRGSTGAAGELGHTIIGADLHTAVPTAGSFPQPGSLESLGAGLALDKLAAQVAGQEPDSALGRLDRPAHGADAVAAAQAGDHAAARIVDLWARRLGIGIANAINTFDPEEVVIGGGAAKAGEWLLEPAREVAMQYLVPGLGTATTIRLAWHGVRAGVLGAALLAAHELEAAAGAQRPPTADADKPAVSHTEPTEVGR